jgi:hypothetical protein
LISYLQCFVESYADTNNTIPKELIYEIEGTSKS